MESRKAAGLAVAGAAGVAVGFGLGYLAFRKPSMSAGASNSEPLPDKPVGPALAEPARSAPQARVPVPPRTVPPSVPAVPSQPTLPGPPAGLQGLLNVLPALLGGSANQSDALSTNGLPAPPTAPPAPPFDPTAPLGTQSNPVVRSRGGNL